MSIPSKGMNPRIATRPGRGCCWQGLPTHLRTFARREAYRKLGGHIRQMDDAPLGLLSEHSYIRFLPPKADGRGRRRPSPTFEGNPHIYGHNGQNGHNSAAGRVSVHCVHSVQGYEPQDCQPWLGPTLATGRPFWYPGSYWRPGTPRGQRRAFGGGFEGRRRAEPVAAGSNSDMSGFTGTAIS